MSKGILISFFVIGLLFAAMAVLQLMRTWIRRVRGRNDVPPAPVTKRRRRPF